MSRFILYVGSDEHGSPTVYATRVWRWRTIEEVLTPPILDYARRILADSIVAEAELSKCHGRTYIWPDGKIHEQGQLPHPSQGVYVDRDPRARMWWLGFRVEPLLERDWYEAVDERCRFMLGQGWL